MSCDQRPDHTKPTATMATPSPAPRLSHSPGLTVRGLSLPLRLRDFGLIAFDMDSTLINIECVDEIAVVAGR